MGRWIVVVLALAGCAASGPRSPEALRQAHLDALAKNDPKAAYELLAPEVRARVDYASFAARWKADAKERAATREAAKKLPSALREPIKGGTSVHEGGVVLGWTQIGGKWLVVSGLPGDRPAATPNDAIRGFITAARTTDLGGVTRYLSAELAESIRRDFSARVDAIEAALAKPGAIELSDDLRRAQLRYEPSRVITLEQTPQGWKITALE
jgi:hypothetical protein